MKKNGQGSTRKISEDKWECIIQSKYINPDSKTLSPKRIKRTGKTEAEAQKKAKQALLIWENNFEKNKNNNKIDRNRTFGSYMEQFIDEEVKPGISASAYKTYIYTMRANFYNYKISRLKLHELNKVEFQIFYDAIINDKSQKTASFPIQLCKRCCEWLVNNSLIERNYAKQAKSKREIRDEYFRKDEEERKTKKEIFTNEDIRKFYEAYKNNISEYCAAIILILETMMRGQEVLALTINDVNFEKNTISIKSAISERFIGNDKNNKLEKYIKVPKNRKERIIYMTPLAKEVILFMLNQTKLKCRNNSNNLVFPSYLRAGKPRTMDAFEIQFKTICDKLGIDRDVRPRRDGRMIGLSVHSLRHTAITIANTAQGANVINTALQSGHTAIRTENIYTHTNIEALKKIETAGSSILNAYSKEDKNEQKTDSVNKLEELLKEKGIKAEDLINLLTKERKS